MLQTVKKQCDGLPLIQFQFSRLFLNVNVKTTLRDRVGDLGTPLLKQEAIGAFRSVHLGVVASTVREDFCYVSGTC